MDATAAAVADFHRLGYVIIPAQVDQAWMAAVRRGFAAWQAGFPPDPHVCTTMLEREPTSTLHAITRPAVLEVVERIIGPWIQLESLTLVAFPTAGPEMAGTVGGWHRDLFAIFPQEGVYHRPLLLNAAIYLQDLSDRSGPLRVIPGSHRRALGIAPEQRTRPHPDEVLVYPRAGDVVLFHNALLHSGSPNLAPAPRFFYCMTYQCSWLKHRGDYGGPHAQAILHAARERGDLRLLRLLGVDDRLFARANWGFTAPDEESWRQWLAEDTAALRGG